MAPHSPEVSQKILAAIEANVQEAWSFVLAAWRLSSLQSLLLSPSSFLSYTPFPSRQKSLDASLRDPEIVSA